MLTIFREERDTVSIKDIHVRMEKEKVATADTSNQKLKCSVSVS